MSSGRRSVRAARSPPQIALCPSSAQGSQIRRCRAAQCEIRSTPLVRVRPSLGLAAASGAAKASNDRLADALAIARDYAAR